MEMAQPVSLGTAVNSRLVNWLPCSVFEDPRPAVAVQGFGQGLDAEPGIQGVGQPPGEHTARGPVHDGHQVQEAALDENVGDISRPDLIRPVDGEPLEKIGVHPVLGMPGGGPRRLVDGLCLMTEQRGASSVEVRGEPGWSPAFEDVYLYL